MEVRKDLLQRKLTTELITAIKRRITDVNKSVGMNICSSIYINTLKIFNTNRNIDGKAVNNQ